MTHSAAANESWMDVTQYLQKHIKTWVEYPVLYSGFVYQSSYSLFASNSKINQWRNTIGTLWAQRPNQQTNNCWRFSVKSLEVVTEYAWNGLGICLEWTWNGPRVGLEWPGICLEWTWNGPGMTWNIPGIYLEWPGMDLEYTWNRAKKTSFFFTQIPLRMTWNDLEWPRIWVLIIIITLLGMRWEFPPNSYHFAQIYLDSLCYDFKKLYTSSQKSFGHLISRWADRV